MSGGDTSRSLSSDVKTQLASGSFVMAHLAKLELNTTYYLTDFSSDVVDGSDTFTANGFLQSLGAVSESSTIDIGAISIAVSNTNQTIFSDVLNNGHLHRKVTLKRAILDDSNAVVGSFVIYSGFIESMAMVESSGSSLISLGVANHWADFQRIEGRRTNDSSQQHHHSGDLGFEFSAQTGKKLFWGNTDMWDEDESTNTLIVIHTDSDDGELVEMPADEAHEAFVAQILRLEAQGGFVWNDSSQQQQYYDDTDIWFTT